MRLSSSHIICRAIVDSKTLEFRIPCADHSWLTKTSPNITMLFADNLTVLRGGISSCIKNKTSIAGCFASQFSFQEQENKWTWRHQLTSFLTAICDNKRVVQTLLLRVRVTLFRGCSCYIRIHRITKCLNAVQTHPFILNGVWSFVQINFNGRMLARDAWVRQCNVASGLMW